VALQLTNPSAERVAFKVKTTSPKKYCVRPSSGIIEPGSVKEVQVIMQAQREAPASYSDCRDKFLIQCAKVDAATKEVTSEVFDVNKARDIKQTKLRVVLIPPAKPPSPVPEGSESEPTSPGMPSYRAPYGDGAKDKAAIQAQLDSRLRGLNAPQSVQRSAVKSARAPRSGYNLVSLLLVAILAFVIGHYTQNAMPEIVEFFHQIKAKYIKR